jgi:hypothetical protein
MPSEAIEFKTQIETLEKQFTGVDNRVIGLSRDVSGIMIAVDKIGTQVGELTRVVTTMQAKPQFDAFKYLTMAVACIGVFGGLATGITYIANSVSYPAILETKHAAQINALVASHLRERLDNGWFHPSRLQIRSPNGTVTPQQ